MKIKNGRGIVKDTIKISGGTLSYFSIYSPMYCITHDSRIMTAQTDKPDKSR